MSTDALLATLIESDKDLRVSISELTKNVSALVIMEGRREEKEKAQVEKNEKYDAFISLNREPMDRVRRAQSHWDKVGDKVWTLIAIAVLSLLGFNFLG